MPAHTHTKARKQTLQKGKIGLYHLHFNFTAKNLENKMKYGIKSRATVQGSQRWLKCPSTSSVTIYKHDSQTNEVSIMYTIYTKQNMAVFRLN